MVDYKDIPIPKNMNKSIATSWRKGYAAFLNNKTLSDCPYEWSHMSMGYCNAWNKGWKVAKSETEFLSD